MPRRQGTLLGQGLPHGAGPGRASPEPPAVLSPAPHVCPVRVPAMAATALPVSTWEVLPPETGKRWESVFPRNTCGHGEGLPALADAEKPQSDGGSCSDLMGRKEGPSGFTGSKEGSAAAPSPSAGRVQYQKLPEHSQRVPPQLSECPTPLLPSLEDFSGMLESLASSFVSELLSTSTRCQPPLLTASFFQITTGRRFTEKLKATTNVLRYLTCALLEQFYLCIEGWQRE